MDRLTYTEPDGDRTFLTCPACGQTARVDLHGDRVAVRCFAGCDPEDTFAGIDCDRLLAELRSHKENWVERLEPEDGAALLDDLAAFIRRFVVVTDAQAAVVALWTVHTHAVDAAETTPYLSIMSAELESGKTRLLEVMDALVARPWLTGRVTAAVLVRKVDSERPTLLLDESDAAFKGEKDYAEALRGLLNTGYRAAGTASLCVGQGAGITYRDFSTFGAKKLFQKGPAAGAANPTPS